MADDAALEVCEEERAVADWRERQMLRACDRDEQIAYTLLLAGVDYHEVESLRGQGVPLDYLTRILA